MSRIEEVKKYEDRLRKIADEIADIADELEMSVHIDSTYSYGSVFAGVSLFDNSDTWYSCKNITTKNTTIKYEAEWEENKRGEQ